MRFFEVWRRFSDWLVSGLTVACGASCFVGAANTSAVGGPLWMTLAMSLAGIILLGAVFLRSRRRAV